MREKYIGISEIFENIRIKYIGNFSKIINKISELTGIPDMVIIFGFLFIGILLFAMKKGKKPIPLSKIDSINLKD